MGLYSPVPKEVVRALKLAADERVLIAAKSPSIFYFIGVTKNGVRMKPGWFILTNRKVVCYYGWIGWTEIDFIPYQDIKNAIIVEDWMAYKRKKFLEINTQSDSFRFAFGTTTKNLCKRIISMDVSNKSVLDNILASIKKRLILRPVSGLNQAI